MPNITESNYKSYIQENEYPVLVLNKSLRTMHSVDITKRFTNLFPKDCPFTNFRIRKVIYNNEAVKNYQNSLAVT